MKKEIIFLILLTCGFISFNYSTVDGFLIKTFSNYETGVVERIVDGDTIVVQSTEKPVTDSQFKIRMLGINSPEKGETGSLEAQKFLEKEILGKEIRIVFGKEKLDLYGRTLSYVFLGNKNINLESVRNGYSNYYFPVGADEFSKEIKNAWNDCLLENIRLCEKSKNQCVKIKNVNFASQILEIENICSYSVDISNWSVKDEGRKKLIFSNKIILPYSTISISAEDFKENYVWTKTGDSVFIRDSIGKLVDFKSI